ncbi:MAG: hypothetical protein N2578_03545 [Bdellovibrionaceae bacterium]|nr:hypothetical protein [Pseudobdellovibrionaceae bacterium]
MLRAVLFLQMLLLVFSSGCKNADPGLFGDLQQFRCPPGACAAAKADPEDMYITTDGNNFLTFRRSEGDVLVEISGSCYASLFKENQIVLRINGNLVHGGHSEMVNLLESAPTVARHNLRCMNGRFAIGVRSNWLSLSNNTVVLQIHGRDSASENFRTNEFTGKVSTQITALQ